MYKTTFLPQYLTLSPREFVFIPEVNFLTTFLHQLLTVQRGLMPDGSEQLAMDLWQVN